MPTEPRGRTVREAVEAAREVRRCAVQESRLLREQSEQRLAVSQERLRLTGDLLLELARGGEGGRYRT